jgi:hypothetical protein
MYRTVGISEQVVQNRFAKKVTPRPFAGVPPWGSGLGSLEQIPHETIIC